MFETLHHFFDPKVILITWPVFLFSLSLHEFFHAWTADRLGDPTPRHLGRLTLNPLAHYDPIGTTLGLLFRMFGWAKPVPVNPAAFRRPKRDMMLTALGGPAVNFVLAFGFAVVFKILQFDAFQPGTLGAAGPTVELLEKIAAYGIFLNIALAVFNLIPLYPLDGHHILRGFLSFKAALAYDRKKHLGAYALMAFIVFGRAVVSAPVRGIITVVFTSEESARLNEVVWSLFA